ncbi:MAG: hypothetical protein IJ196_05805 [Prevotella sp.]|nr:hypothetical protein [Prevotella sp.]
MTHPSEQTTQQIDRAIRKIAQKFPYADDTAFVTDIHLRATQESGELLAFDDDDNEINRCVIEQWIDNKDEDFYESVTDVLRNRLKHSHELVDSMGIMKPYSFVLEDEDKETIAELYVADDETIIIGDDLMKDLDEDLDEFFKKLFE